MKRVSVLDPLDKQGNAMIGFALCHGWSFDASALAPLQAALLQRFPLAPQAVFDLGFTGDERSALLAADREWIAVGHSYGFAYLMQQPVPWKAAISINGFTRFCRRPGQPEGTPVRLVNAMRERLEQDPRATVQEFHLRCGAVDTVPDRLDLQRLQLHLTQLRDLELAPPQCATLAFATQGDAIAPLALAQACFSQPGCILQELPGDHMRLMQEPAPCINAVSQWMENLYA